ncbi:hypothetical protein [Methylobacterium sp.]|jgi:hypothetical protein|nr:hypothetical protein [Methylobacterium sp.]MDB5647452.1 hypothetical protein [Methylobacterium sp.]
MQTRWMTLRDIAEDRHITLAEARALVDALRCPKVFRPDSTLYLV